MRTAGAEAMPNLGLARRHGVVFLAVLRLPWTLSVDEVDQVESLRPVEASLDALALVECCSV